MPLTIIVVALYGWMALGFVPATALLLGAVIAPTDPVLASEVQTTHPHEDDYSSSRLALTAEARLNDGLAFPFTNMAIALAAIGLSPYLWLVDWIVYDVIYKIVMGVIVGVITGWALSKTVFSYKKLSTNESFISIGIYSLSLTLIPYGIAEILGCYGFISVFVAACVFRNEETRYEDLQHLHDFSEVMEKVFIAILFTLLGTYIVHHFIHDF